MSNLKTGTGEERETKANLIAALATDLVSSRTGKQWRPVPLVFSV